VVKDERIHFYIHPKGKKSKRVSFVARRQMSIQVPETVIRASGDCLCPVCGKQYRKHPAVEGLEWATRLCNGRCVKL